MSYTMMFILGLIAVVFFLAIAAIGKAIVTIAHEGSKKTNTKTTS